MIELVWLYGAFVGVADAIRLKGLADAYINLAFAGSTFWRHYSHACCIGLHIQVLQLYC